MPANGFPGRLRASSLRLLAILAIVAAALGLAYATARFTSLFALRDLEITGGSAAVRDSVREAGKPFLGESLVALDQDGLRDRLEALPTVRSIRIDRAFPHALRIVVVSERPLAVVRSGQEAWLVSERGRVIRRANPEASRRPVVWTAGETHLEPGSTVADDDARLALEGLRLLPEAFPVRVESATAVDGGVTLLTAAGTEVRLGKAEAVALKLAVAARVLGSLSAAERAGLAYIDVSVPERPVGGATLNSQLEG